MYRNAGGTLIWLAIIIPVIVVAAKVALDYRTWLRKRDTVEAGKSIIKHWVEWFAVLILCLPSIIIFAKHSLLSVWYALGLSAAMDCFFIWLFFDGLFNVVRGFNWWYTGSGEKTAANTDKVLRALPVFLQIIIKVGGLAAFTFYYLKTML